MNTSESLMQGFEHETLDAAKFTHRDHVAVAYELLRRHSFLEASARYGSCLQTIATKAGAAQKFNTTVTLAFLGLIAERMENADTETFETFIADNRDLLDRSPLDRWYTQDRIGSDLAKRIFLLPDKSPIEAP
ncbi:MAG: hypothetical protein AAGC96_03540 [Pseudomonadota bacterium]